MGPEASAMWSKFPSHVLFSRIYISKINLTLVIKKGGPLRIGKRILSEGSGEESFGIPRKKTYFLQSPRPESIEKNILLLKNSACVKISSEVDLKVINYSIASFKMLFISNKYF